MAAKITLTKELFEMKISPEPMSGCWIWTEGLNNAGYGWLRFNRRPTLAHRVSYQFYIGEIPKGAFILHHCDTPCCVNPHHLYAGTPKDNALDRARRYRGTGKLSNNQVIEIREKFKLGTFTQSQLAKDYGLSIAQMSLLVRRKSYIDA